VQAALSADFCIKKKTKNNTEKKWRRIGEIQKMNGIPEVFLVKIKSLLIM
jgi:hypothetical protein